MWSGERQSNAVSWRTMQLTGAAEVINHVGFGKRKEEEGNQWEKHLEKHLGNAKKKDKTCLAGGLENSKSRRSMQRSKRGPQAGLYSDLYCTAHRKEL